MYLYNRLTEKGVEPVMLAPFSCLLAALLLVLQQLTPAISPCRGRHSRRPDLRGLGRRALTDVEGFGATALARLPK